MTARLSGGGRPGGGPVGAGGGHHRRGHRAAARGELPPLPRRRRRLPREPAPSGAGTHRSPCVPPRIPPTDPILVVEPMTEPVRAVDEPTSLGGQVRELVRWARAAYRGSPAEGRLDDLAHRLDEPLRIAVLATVDDGRRMLVEALIGTPDVPHPLDGVAGAGPVRLRRPGRREPDRTTMVVTLPAPALRAMTLIDTPDPAARSTDPPTRRWPTPSSCSCTTGGPRTWRCSTCCTQPDTAVRSRCWRWRTRRGRRRSRRCGSSATTRPSGASATPSCPVAPATAVAAARLGDDEHGGCEQWVARAPEPSGGDRGRLSSAPSATVTDVPVALPDDGSEIATALLDRLGPLGARRAAAAGAGRRGGHPRGARGRARPAQRAGGAAGADRFAVPEPGRRAAQPDRCWPGSTRCCRTAPPATRRPRGCPTSWNGSGPVPTSCARSSSSTCCARGGLNLPDEQRSAAERLLGADGDDVRARLGLAADATAEQVRRGGGRQVVRWRQIADHPVASTRVRDAAQDAGADVRAPGGRDRRSCSAVTAVEGRAGTNEGEDDDDVATWPRLGVRLPILAGGRATGRGLRVRAAGRVRTTAVRRGTERHRRVDRDRRRHRCRRCASPRRTARATPSPTTPRWLLTGHRSTWRSTTGAARPRSGSTSRGCCRTAGTPRTRTSTPAGRPATRPARTSRTRSTPPRRPGKPSTDPAFANPQNEIWLDLRTDGDGDGESRAEVPFAFTDRAPASIVIHEAETTGTAPGQAGSAGARLACVTVPFR